MANEDDREDDPILGPEDVSEEKVEEKEDERKQKKLDIVRAYKAVFKSPKARTVLKDMAVTCGLLSKNFTTDPHLNAFRQGRREVIIEIFEVLEVDELDIIDYLTKDEESDEKEYFT